MNPALPGGASVDDPMARDRAWTVGARASYTFVPYGKLQQGTSTAPNPEQLAIDVHLATVQAIAAAPTGTSFDVQLPFGTLATSSLSGDRTDTGIGDLELRVRQLVQRDLQLGVAAGVVVPTGPYAPRAGAANLAPEASYLTLGRGVTWWLAEVDARRAIAGRTSAFAQLSTRGPFGQASDGYAWGAEVRGLGGARVTVLPRRLAIVASSDLQWRAGASEPDPFSAGRLDTANAGGWLWTGSLSASIDALPDVSLLIGVRVPIVSDVHGNQLVPQTGAFAAVSYRRQLAARRTPRYEPAPGMITVVDYTASWCAPCAEIGRALAGAAGRWPDVRIVSIDATEWPADGAPRLPDGAAGLPVIELYDRSGVRRILAGADALRIVEEVEALRGAGSR